MLHHLSLPVENLQDSIVLYDAMMKAIGYRRVLTTPTASGYGVIDGQDKLLLMQVIDARSASAGFHIAFSAPSRESVDNFYADALKHGAIDNGRPGFRKHYGPGYYAAFVVDLDGHRIEAVHTSEDRNI